MHHTITAIGSETGADNTIAAPSGLTGTDLITIPDGGIVASINSVGDFMALALTLKVAGPTGFTPTGDQLEPGDTIAVIGSVGSIPDYQRGGFLTVDADRLAHFPNAGHLAAAFSA